MEPIALPSLMTRTSEGIVSCISQKLWRKDIYVHKISLIMLQNQKSSSSWEWGHMGFTYEWHNSGCTSWVGSIDRRKKGCILMAMSVKMWWNIGKDFLNAGRSMKSALSFMTTMEIFFWHPQDSLSPKVYNFSWFWWWWVHILWEWLPQETMDQWQHQGHCSKERWGPVNYSIQVFNIRMWLAKRWRWVRILSFILTSVGLTFWNSEACVFFKAGKNRDGYFDADDLLQQVENTIDIFESKTNGFVW